MSEKKEDEYVVLFKGAKLSKKQSNIAGMSIIFAIVGVFLVFALSLQENKPVSYSIILAFLIFGFFIGIRKFK